MVSTHIKPRTYWRKWLKTQLTSKGITRFDEHMQFNTRALKQQMTVGGTVETGWSRAQGWWAGEDAMPLQCCSLLSAAELIQPPTEVPFLAPRGPHIFLNTCWLEPREVCVQSFPRPGKTPLETDGTMIWNSQDRQCQNRPKRGHLVKVGTGCPALPICSTWGLLLYLSARWQGEV
jgi:hypothetical protein